MIYGQISLVDINSKHLIFLSMFAPAFWFFLLVSSIVSVTPGYLCTSSHVGLIYLWKCPSMQEF